MQRGRKPGSFLTGTCTVCGARERVRGVSSRFRCTPCKDAHAQQVGHWPDRGYSTGVVAVAIRSGKLPHPSGMACADCGGPAVEYEHRDYNKPLEVEPVCRGCNLRRGPAIPRAGTIENRIEQGIVPYTLRCKTVQLFDLLGLDTTKVRELPAKLTLEHWQAIWPAKALTQPTDSSVERGNERSAGLVHAADSLAGH